MLRKSAAQDIETSHFHHLTHELFPNFGLILNQKSKKTLLGRLTQPGMEKADLDVSQESLSQANNLIFLMHKATLLEEIWFSPPEVFAFVKRWFLTQEAPIRIWSVGCGCGQEAYSLSCALSEAEYAFKRRLPPPVEILASDVSLFTLERAKAAVYTKEELQRGVSWFRKKKFFHKEDHWYRLADKERQRVKFFVQDILKGFHHLEDFDLIFCTSILKYFSKNLRYAILYRLCDRLKMNGYLFLGKETLDISHIPCLKPISIESIPCYQKVPLA